LCKEPTTIISKWKVVVVAGKRADIIAELQGSILRLQGFKPGGSNSLLDSRLGSIRYSFPNSTFPLGAIHEFLTAKREDTAATVGFIGGILSALLGKKGAAMWISCSRTLFPPALKNFGIDPERLIFIDLKNESDVIWAMDEALKCGALSAVVGEVQKISFTESRRLQLAVEKSNVSGFIVRKDFRKLDTTACVSRWRISSLPSERIDELPGVGIPTWKVELLRIRNGRPNVWNIQFKNGRFKPVEELSNVPIEQQKKTG
jgi:protein ImuA